ncbi:MAG: class I SAM-dependent methyltransferase [Actinomycetota bacterium]
MTRRLARVLRLRRGERVLDVACGRGGSALLLADEFAASVDGVDLGRASVEHARAEAIRRDLDGLTRFHVGDAERLPFPDATFDVVICECSLCTFPDKDRAAAEFARVLRPGGRLGLTDVTLDPARLDPELATLAGSIACLAGARPAAEYEALLATAGLETTVSEAHDYALAHMVDQIDARLRALGVLWTTNGPFDTEALLGHTARAAAAVADGVAGYCLLVARRS